MKSILLATANVDRIISLTDLFLNQGYVVIPACDADMALSFFRDNVRPDAVIIDNGMKGFWGILGAVRLVGPVPPPIIVMSERVSVTDYLDALNMGAFDFVFLPVSASAFVRVVDAAMEHSSRSAALRDRLPVAVPGNPQSGHASSL